jgi:hypothetical protein
MNRQAIRKTYLRGLKPLLIRLLYGTAEPVPFV